MDIDLLASASTNGTALDVISVAEACSLLGVHRNTLYKLIHEGELPAFKLAPGGRWRFRRAELEQWIEDKQGRGVR